MEQSASHEDTMSVIRPTASVPPPPRPVQLCRGCGKLLLQEQKDAGVDLHPGCSAPKPGPIPNLTINAPTLVPGSNHPMRTILLDQVRWASSNAPRSLQVGLGPSEVGGSCDRRLAMRIAGLRTVNRTSDPWPAIVGTAIHDWLQRCLELDNQRLVAAGKSLRWVTEVKVRPDLILTGKADAFDLETGTVIDWKTMGDTSSKRLAEDGPSLGYQIQIQTYGLGFYRAGYEVKKVALMFLPRSGMLKSARYFEWPFNPAMAQEAIERVYRIGREVLRLQSDGLGDRVWENIPCDPGALCGWCPFFRRDSAVVTENGCPGH